jgi:hypothetical protein
MVIRDDKENTVSNRKHSQTKPRNQNASDRKAEKCSTYLYSSSVVI